MPEIERGLVTTSFGHIHYRTPAPARRSCCCTSTSNPRILYRELIAALAPAFRVVAIDYPEPRLLGPHGFQPTIADYATCVAEVMQALGHARYACWAKRPAPGWRRIWRRRRKDQVTRCVMVNCPELTDDPEGLLGEFKTDFGPPTRPAFRGCGAIEWLLAHDPVHAPLAPDQDWMDRLNRAQIECGRDRWQALTALLHYDLKAAQARHRLSGAAADGRAFLLPRQGRGDRRPDPRFPRRSNWPAPGSAPAGSGPTRSHRGCSTSRPQPCRRNDRHAGPAFHSAKSGQRIGGPGSCGRILDAR